jgi:hypothetical protein
VTASTQPAPLAARHRYAYLRPLRFFVVFYPGNRRLLAVSALDARGRLVGKAPAGYFTG